MKRLLLCALAMVGLSLRPAVTAADERFAISVNGQPQCVITVADEPSPAGRPIRSAFHIQLH